MSLKNGVIGIAILLLTISVVVYGVNTFYKSPNYEDYCGDYRIRQVIETQIQCEDTGGKWTAQERKCITTPCPQGSCDSDFTCRQTYESSREKYSRNLFLIVLPLGVGLIALGTLVFGLEAVGAGLMAGGVGVILWGVGGFWRFADDWLKFIMSLIGLIVVIKVAYYFNDIFGKKGRKKR